MKQILKNIFPWIKLPFNVSSFILFIICVFGLDYICNNNSHIFALKKGMHMHFKSVAETFKKIDEVSSRTEITKLLAELLKKASAYEAECICNLSLGILRPSYQGGTQFNMAEKSLIKVVASLVNLSQEQIEHLTKELGDLGLVVDATNFFRSRRT